MSRELDPSYAMDAVLDSGIRLDPDALDKPQPGPLLGARRASLTYKAADEPVVAEVGKTLTHVSTD